jgi:hypothetical protein
MKSVYEVVEDIPKWKDTRFTKGILGFNDERNRAVVVMYSVKDKSILKSLYNGH